MYENKFSKIITIIIIIVIIAIFGILIYFGYEYINFDKINKNGLGISNINESNKEVDDNKEDEFKNNIDENITEENKVELTEILNKISNTSNNANITNNSNNMSNNSTERKETYQGYNVIGKIKIPATDIEYPILEECTKTTIEIGVAKMYGSNPNEVGNLTLVSHNYRNGKLFSNNKKLSIGDKIYITDMTGTKLEYVIYKKYETTPEDTTFMKRDTNGAKEISLSTCTDDSSMRLIICAKAE